MLAVHVLSQIRETLGLQISLRQFFEMPTISALAKTATVGASDRLPKYATTVHSLGRLTPVFRRMLKRLFKSPIRHTGPTAMMSHRQLEVVGGWKLAQVIQQSPSEQAFGL